MNVHNITAASVCPHHLPTDDDSTGGKRDFNNTVINFTIPTGETAFEFSLADIVMMDDVNEASEQFILVLEIESDGVEFDEHEGLLVVTILDNNREGKIIIFHLNMLL